MQRERRDEETACQNRVQGVSLELPRKEREKKDEKAVRCTESAFSG